MGDRPLFVGLTRRRPTRRVAPVPPKLERCAPQINDVIQRTRRRHAKDDEDDEDGDVEDAEEGRRSRGRRGGQVTYEDVE